MEMGLQFDGFLALPTFGTRVVLCAFQDVGCKFRPRITLNTAARVFDGMALTVVTVMPSKPGAATCHLVMVSWISSDVIW